MGNRILALLAAFLMLMPAAALAHEGSHNEGFFEKGGHFFSDFFGGIGSFMASAFSEGHESSEQTSLAFESDNSGSGSSENSGSGNSEELLVSEELKISADADNGAAEARAELEFFTDAAERETIINEILERLDNVTAEDISSIIKINDNAEEMEKRMEIKTQAQNGMTRVEFEFRFPLSTDERDGIVNEITGMLHGLTADELSEAFNARVRVRAEENVAEDEAVPVGDIEEIEVKVFEDTSKVEIKDVNGLEEEFFLNTTDLEVIVQELVSRTGLTAEEVNSLLDVELENEDQMEDNSGRGSNGSSSGSMEKEMSDNHGINSGPGNVNEDDNDDNSGREAEMKDGSRSGSNSGSG